MKNNQDDWEYQGKRKDQVRSSLLAFVVSLILGILSLIVIGLVFLFK